MKSAIFLLSFNQKISKEKKPIQCFPDHTQVRYVQTISPEIVESERAF